MSRQAANMPNPFSRNSVRRYNRRKERKFSKRGDLGRGGSLTDRRKEDQKGKGRRDQNQAPEKAAMSSVHPHRQPGTCPPGGRRWLQAPGSQSPPGPARLLLPLPFFRPAERRARLLLPAAENREDPLVQPRVAPGTVRAQVEAALARGVGRCGPRHRGPAGRAERRPGPGAAGAGGVRAPAPRGSAGRVCAWVEGTVRRAAGKPRGRPRARQGGVQRAQKREEETQ